MDIESQKSIEQYVRGAINKNVSPFSSLEVPSSVESPGKEFVHQWILPFYKRIDGRSEEFLEHYSCIKDKLSPDIIATLLTWENWRSRLVGAYFTAIEKRNEFEEQIGRLLLRSDLCFAGEGYVIVLATFNSNLAVAFLTQYLDYYLIRRDLNFDQGIVIAAVAYLDTVNNTNILEKYLPEWHSYCGDQDLSILEQRLQFLLKQINLVHCASDLNYKG